MSSNKGKDGEMKVIKIIADIAIQEDGFDFTRPTITNESDMGADLMLKSSLQSLNYILQVAEGTSQSTDSIERSRKTIVSRVDVKTTQSKLQTDTVEKFASDVHKHPKCIGHILMGGNGLTAPAQRKFNEYKENFEQNGKVLAYISNEGISRLES
jgi:hypothetical protein